MRHKVGVSLSFQQAVAVAMAHKHTKNVKLGIIVRQRWEDMQETLVRQKLIQRRSQQVNWLGNAITFACGSNTSLCRGTLTLNGTRSQCKLCFGISQLNGGESCAVLTTFKQRYYGLHTASLAKEAEELS